jgi:hypothetical protein
MNKEIDVIGGVVVGATQQPRDYRSVLEMTANDIAADELSHFRLALYRGDGFHCIVNDPKTHVGTVLSFALALCMGMISHFVMI